MIGHELRQVSLCSAAQAVLSTLSTQWRHSPRFSRPLGATGAPGAARGGVGRQASSAGDGQVVRRRRGDPNSGLGSLAGPTKLPVARPRWAAPASVGGASLHCQRGGRGEGAASLSGWPRAAARGFFLGSALLRGRPGPWRRGSCGHESGSPTSRCQRHHWQAPGPAQADSEPARPGARAKPREPGSTWGCGRL
jgi:hypothetical protein